MMGFGSKDKTPEPVADIPPYLSDLHCFTETEGVITTSSSRLVACCLRHNASQRPCMLTASLPQP